MCTYLTNTTAVAGSGLVDGEWINVDRAVVYFDHPVDAPFDHALCLDIRGGGSAAERVAVELDAASARRLAETILAVLDAPETLEVTRA